MTNLEFVQFVLDDKKVQYDLNLIDKVIYNYFIQSISTIEREIDFHYMLNSNVYLGLKDNYYLNIPQSKQMKYVKSVFNKDRNYQLSYKASVIEDVFLAPPGQPRYFFVKEGYYLNLPNVDYTDDSYIVFDCKLDKDTYFIVSYYMYTFNEDRFISKTSIHPLLKINSELLYWKLSSFIDFYYNDLHNFKFSLDMYEKLKGKELSNQNFKSGKFQELTVKGLDRL